MICRKTDWLYPASAEVATSIRQISEIEVLLILLRMIYSFFDESF